MVVSATTEKLSGLYADLTSQIKHSVDIIKNKSDFSTEINENKDPDKKINNIGSFSFSYLEPSTAYNVHVVSSQVFDSDKVKKEQTPRQQIDEKTDDSTQVIEEQESISFFEELQNHVSLDARNISKLYQKNAFSSYSEIPLYIEGSNFRVYDSEYAAQAYTYTFNINKEPDKRIEYMYKYDKSFDYRV